MSFDETTRTNADTTRQIARDVEGIHPIRADAIHGYRILRHLGAGASSTVYLAKEDGSEKLVALKVLSAYYSKNREALRRWDREAKTLQKLRHPNIVEGIGSGEAEGRPYFVMEFVQGETLSNRLRRLGNLPENEMWDITEQVLAALHAAHQIGVIHRDIKPSNIVRMSDGKVKLMDFGLAREEDDRTLTNLGAVLGTPIYISPEQARGDLNIDIRSDLYSLGVMMFHLVTGDLPFGDLNTALLLTKKITDDLPDVRDFKVDVTENCATFVRKLCQRERTARPTTPREAIEMLDVVRSGGVLPSDGKSRTAVIRMAPTKVTVTNIASDNPLLRSVLEDSTLVVSQLHLETNEVLFYEEDTSRDAYILMGGSLEVIKAGRRIAVLDKPGSWLGEMSTLLNAPRTGTMRALAPTNLLKVDETCFRQFIMRHPQLCYELSVSLAERLEKTNVQLREAQRKLAVIEKYQRMMQREFEE